MKSFRHVALGTIIGVAGLTPVTANAATLYNNWQYALDSIGDVDGGPEYDMRGMAYTTVGNTAYVAVSSSLALGGTTNFPDALNGRISLGDMYFNFSGHNLDKASKFTDSQVFGIRFDVTNDSFGNLIASPNTSLGVFGNIKTVSLASANQGPFTLDAYNSFGLGRTTNAMGDLQSTTGDVSDYLGYTELVQTNIESGTKLGDISLLNRSQLSGLGVNFNHFGSQYDDTASASVFGFSFDRRLMPAGDFTAHLFEECNNDGVAINIRGTAAVPEPGAIAMLVGMGVTGVGLVARRRKQ